MRLLPLLAMLPLIACSGQSDATDAASTASAGGDPVAAQGSGTSRSYDVTGFDQVDLRGSDDIDVRVGPAFAIQATGPAELLDKLEIVRDGDTLKVGRRGNSVSWGGDKGRAIKIMVTMRSEEHTSELQSLMRNSYAVFCLTKKKETDR